MKQIFCETGKSFKILITEIYFEDVGYNFEAIMVMRSVQVPLSLLMYSTPHDVFHHTNMKPP